VFGIEHVIIEAGDTEKFSELRVIGSGDNAVDGQSLFEFGFESSSGVGADG